MEGLLARHITIYSKPQVLLLMELIETLSFQPFFVSDDFFWSVDRTTGNEYPPLSKSGDNWFTLGTEVEKKYLIPFFNRTKLVDIGKITWEFNIDTFKSIDLVINKPIMTFDEKQKKDQVADLLRQTFKCPVNSYNEQFAENVVQIKTAQTAAAGV